MEPKQRKIDGSRSCEKEVKPRLCVLRREKRERVEKMLRFIQNPQNTLRMVLKLGSIWDFPAKIQ